MNPNGPPPPYSASPYPQSPQDAGFINYQTSKPYPATAPTMSPQFQQPGYVPGQPSYPVYPVYGAQVPQYRPLNPSMPVQVVGVQFDAGMRPTPNQSIPPPPPGYAPNVAQQLAQSGYQVHLSQNHHDDGAGWTFW